MRSPVVAVMAEELERVDLVRARRQELARQTTEAVRVDFLGTALEICFDDRRACAAYARRYERFRTNASPTKRAFAVRDETSELFWYEDRAAYRWPGAPLDFSARDFLADSVVRREFFSEIPGFLTFHAAAVAVERGAVAIIAPSTGGKTTTAVACARRGMGLFTDEECISENGWVHPFPRAINLRADGIERMLNDPVFPDDGMGERLRARAGGPWACASFDELLGPRPLPEPRQLVATYFIRPGNGSASIAPMRLAEAVPLFFSAWPRSRLTGPDRVAEAVLLFSGAPPYSLTLGTPDETARAIEAAGRL